MSTASRGAKAEAGDPGEALVIIKGKENELDQDDRDGGGEKVVWLWELLLRIEPKEFVDVWVCKAKQQNVKDEFRLLAQTTSFCHYVISFYILIICFASKSILNKSMLLNTCLLLSTFPDLFYQLIVGFFFFF